LIKKIMKHKLAVLFVIVAGIVSAVPAMSCTSVIISSKATTTGKPIMYKHRDTDDLNNRIGYFEGPKYRFIGLENASTPGNEVWTGTNSVGFSIMNTASYNIKDDNVPDSEMDREGSLMFKALGVCATTADFEHFLDTLSKPMGVEANFGVIDAKGGAAYYEVNNYKWVKYDVNDPNVAPAGYRVVTNFSFSGRREDYKGYERYLTASAIMKEIEVNGKVSTLDHTTLFNSFSRCYRHEYMGMDYTKNYDSMLKSGFFNGKAVDQDFIPRRITSAEIVVEGVKPGDDPKYTVMWTILGYPTTSVALPLLVGDSDILPDYVKCSSNSTHSEISDIAMDIKMKYVFPEEVSNGKNYINLENVLRGKDGKPALYECCYKVENEYINPSFAEIYQKWSKGKMKDEKFYSSYRSSMKNILDIYKSIFSSFIL